MSVPVQNTAPLARTTNARSSGDASTRSQALVSASYIAHVIALPASGRLMVKNATGPRDMKSVVDAFTIGILFDEPTR
jgi:hypothetical protein